MIWRRWIERDDFRHSHVSFWSQQNKRLHQVLSIPAELQRQPRYHVCKLPFCIFLWAMHDRVKLSSWWHLHSLASLASIQPFWTLNFTMVLSCEHHIRIAQTLHAFTRNVCEETLSSMRDSCLRVCGECDYMWCTQCWNHEVKEVCLIDSLPKKNFLAS
jgi:hypothetical protein